MSSGTGGNGCASRTAFIANRSRISAPEELPELEELRAGRPWRCGTRAELALEPAIARLARVDPVGLDLLADFIEVVLVLGLRGVERDRVALDTPAAPSKPSAAGARMPKDAGRGRTGAAWPGRSASARRTRAAPQAARRGPVAPSALAGGVSAWRGRSRRVRRLHGRRLGGLRQRIRGGRRRLGRRFWRRRGRLSLGHLLRRLRGRVGAADAGALSRRALWAAREPSVRAAAFGAGGRLGHLGVGAGGSGAFGAGSAGGPAGREGLPSGAFSSGLSGAMSTRSGSPRLT